MRIAVAFALLPLAADGTDQGMSIYFRPSDCPEAELTRIVKAISRAAELNGASMSKELF